MRTHLAVLVAVAVGRIVKRHAIIDLFWGAGFLVVYFESLVVVHHVTLPVGLQGAVRPVDFVDRSVVLVFVAPCLFAYRTTSRVARAK